MSVSSETGIFIDTNILVYAYDFSAGRKHSLAAQTLEDCWETGSGCLSIQVLQEFFVIATRKIAKPLDSSSARQIVADLGLWRCHAPEVGDLLQAIDLQQQYRLSFRDALVLQSAARLGCKRLISEDLSHGSTYGVIQVVNPFIE